MRTGVPTFTPLIFGIPPRIFTAASSPLMRRGPRGHSTRSRSSSDVRSESRFAAGYLRTADAARFLSLSGRTLEKHRTYGTGPAYRKLGGRVVYALDDLKAWAERGAKT